MPKNEDHSTRRLYWLTASLGALGSIFCWWLQGPMAAASFALGALGSLGNLWMWDWLTGVIAPAETPRKSFWQPGLFVGRYLILLGAGYAIVKVLGVNPIAVIMGLLTSAAAVLLALIIEITQGFFGNNFNG